MTTKAQVEGFLEQQRVALVGASRSGTRFGNTVLRELRAKGYEVFPIHAEADEIDGVQCRRGFSDLPNDVSCAVLVVPPSETERLIPVAARSGIRRVWMQQGAESQEAVRLCRELGIAEVHGECILMFAEPAGFVHRAHRWLWGLLGKLPEDG